MIAQSGPDRNSGCQIVQIGLTTRELSGTLRLYAELFGFVNAGGIPIWGGPMSVQGLDSSARGLMWWLVGEQAFFQLEIFQYGVPSLRPQRTDWRPCDHGWVRFGVRVQHIEPVIARLADWSISPLGRTQDQDGSRRLVFRDPFVGTIIEVLEDASRAKSNRPAIVYATSSVSDLRSARRFYGETLMLPIEPRERLHRTEHEALWGLENAGVEGFLVAAGDILVEVVQYTDPVGRPKAGGFNVADQGIMNVALGSRDVEHIRRLSDRVRQAGLRMSTALNLGSTFGTYVLEAEREIELVSLPPSMDAQWGFEASAPFLGVAQK